jgi:hypothetical protein
MSELLSQLHDATLLTISFDWRVKSCTFSFAGAPSIPGPFQIEWSAVDELVVPRTDAWGESASVLSAKSCGANRYELQMQSGDVIVVVSANYSLKRTAADGLR